MQNEKRRPATGLRDLCLIHDNASAHKCVLVQDFFKEEKVVQLSHPPYSPDLSPCDFFLFPLLKKTLFGRRYESRSALGRAIYHIKHYPSNNPSGHLTLKQRRFNFDLA